MVAGGISTLKSIISTLRINNSNSDAYSILYTYTNYLSMVFSAIFFRHPSNPCVSHFFFCRRLTRKCVPFEFYIKITMSLKCLSGRKKEKKSVDRRAQFHSNPSSSSFSFCFVHLTHRSIRSIQNYYVFICLQSAGRE